MCVCVCVFVCVYVSVCVCVFGKMIFCFKKNNILLHILTDSTS